MVEAIAILALTVFLAALAFAVGYFVVDIVFKLFDGEKK